MRLAECTYRLHQCGLRITSIIHQFKTTSCVILQNLGSMCIQNLLDYVDVVITEAFGEPDENAIAPNGACCDVCNSNHGAMRDHRAEFEIAADAQCLSTRGKVKLTEWIHGNKRAWMEHFDKTSMSFGSAMEHSEM